MKNLYYTIIMLLVACTCLTACWGTQQTAEQAPPVDSIHINQIANYSKKINENQVVLINDSNRVMRIQPSIDSLNGIINTAYQERSTDSLNMMLYVLDHKMATCAILAGVGSTPAATDFRNEYSKDEQTFGKVILAVAAIWAIGNHEEVMDVLTEFGKFSAHRDYQASMVFQSTVQIQALNSQRVQLRQDIATLTANNNSYVASIDDLKRTYSL